MFSFYSDTGTEIDADSRNLKQALMMPEVSSRTWCSSITESKNPAIIHNNLISLLERHYNLKRNLYLDSSKTQAYSPISRCELVKTHQNAMRYLSQEILRKRVRVGLEKTYFLAKLITCTILLSAIPPITKRYPAYSTEFEDGQFIAGLIIGTLTIIVSNITAVHAEALKKLEGLQTEVDSFFDTLFKALPPEPAHTTRMFHVLPSIKDALKKKHYTLHQARSVDPTLFEAVAKSLSQYGDKINSRTVETAFNAQPETMPKANNFTRLAQLYQRPVLLISETPFNNDSYYKLIDVTAEEDQEEKESEDGEQRAIVLYTCRTGHFQAVDTRLHGEERTLDRITRELSTLCITSPEEPAQEPVQESVQEPATFVRDSAAMFANL